ncbi:hypothetical protein BD413DRAFT_570277 [Trametes elegans]|nr:hypothetical protein BD413DRAFT_570277 [Trametes elegans]
MPPIVWISIPSPTCKSKPRSSLRSLRRKSARLSQVAQNAGGNGGASDDISELAVEKPPTGKEVLQAASVVLRFSLMLDDTAACKTESALARFTRQTHPDAQRAMKETTITQYVFLVSSNRVLRRLVV